MTRLTTSGGVFWLSAKADFTISFSRLPSRKKQNKINNQTNCNQSKKEKCTYFR